VSEAGFEALGDGRFRVTGALSFESVPGLFEQGQAALGAVAEPTIDLGAVTAVDSAGLALLIEWLRAAQGRGVRLRFTGVPEKLRALARISEVDAFLEGAAG
jgi:phospholipid transport system transporter-binding protein